MNNIDTTHRLNLMVSRKQHQEENYMYLYVCFIQTQIYANTMNPLGKNSTFFSVNLLLMPRMKQIKISNFTTHTHSVSDTYNTNSNTHKRIICVHLAIKFIKFLLRGKPKSKERLFKREISRHMNTEKRLNCIE